MDNNFINKYEFPLHLIIAIKIIRIHLANIIPTFFARTSLNLMGCKFGKYLIVNGKCYFRVQRKGAISFGENIKITSRFLSNSVGISNPTFIECATREATLAIGNNTGLTSCIISCRNKITIGNNVKIGGNVRIFDHDFHSLNHLNRRNYAEDSLFTKSSPVIIEDDVFIGTNSIILKGVHIGARSIIGSGSIVVNDIPEDCIAAGNPARVIRRIN